MMKIALLCLFVGCAVASYLPYTPYRPKEVKIVKVVEKPTPAPKPQPYEFKYDIVDEDGNKQGRAESGDAHGVVTGSYSMQLADGRQRWVEYVADGDGFRPVVRTNEPGTEDQDPADVDLTVDGPIEIKEAPKKPERKYKLVKVPVHGYGY